MSRRRLGLLEAGGEKKTTSYDDKMYNFLPEEEQEQEQEQVTGLQSWLTTLPARVPCLGILLVVGGVSGEGIIHRL